MKNVIKVLGIIALVAVIGFSMTACEGDDGDGEDGNSSSGNNVAVTGVTLSPTTLSLTKSNDTGTLTATVVPNNATNKIVSWSTSDSNVATVTGGTVTAVANGSAIITVMTADGSYSDTCEVTVTGFVPVWTAISNNIFGNINSIVYCNNTFVAVGASGIIVTSINGTTWSAVSDSTFGTYNGISAIAYGNNTFVAVGDNGKMATSTDNCVTWTAVSDSKIWDYISGNYGRTAGISDIAYGNGMFIAVGGNYGKMATSTDNGVTWTAVSDSKLGNTEYDSIYAIVYENNIFIAGGRNGKMATSSDGATWTAVSDSTFENDAIYTIAYNNKMFVAGGSNGKIATSTDNGVTWTAVLDSKFDYENINAIVYGNNMFVAVGDHGKMATSSDGTTWTAVSNSKFGYDNSIYALVYGNNMFIAAGIEQYQDIYYRGKMWYLSDN